MVMRKRPATPETRAEFVAEVMRDRAVRDKTYREMALAMYPHVCGRCGREFAGKNLRELTVHHIDHNHFNNPADGSNWELLCLYCHDQEHETNQRRDLYQGAATGLKRGDSLGFQAFEGLKGLLPEEGDSSAPEAE